MYPRHAFIITIFTGIGFFSLPKAIEWQQKKQFEMEEEYFEAKRKYKNDLAEWKKECDLIRKAKAEQKQAQ